MIPTFQIGQFGRASYVAPASSGHRYWRLNATANANGGASGNLALSEVELRESIGGADVTGSGTASASTTTEGSASQAFDNNSSTYWAASAGSGWLKYDFGVGQSKNIVEIAITSRAGGTWHIQAPRDFSLEWSDDNSTWTPVFSRTYEVGWGVAETRAFSAGSSSSEVRFWRIYITGRNQTAISIAEIEFRTSLGGADTTTSGNAGQNIEGGGVSGGSGYFAPQAFDNNASTFWYRYNEPVWIGHVWSGGSGPDVVQFAITARNDTFSTQGPKDFELQSSTDGVTWTTVATVTNQTAWGNAEQRVFTV